MADEDKPHAGHCTAFIKLSGAPAPGERLPLLILQEA